MVVRDERICDLQFAIGGKNNMATKATNPAFSIANCKSQIFPLPPLQSFVMKFGRIKRQHGRVGGLDEILNVIVRNCPYVSRIVPGRIKVRRGKTPASFKIQYPTNAGLKCLYTGTGTVQEVFLICSDIEAAKEWLIKQEIATKVPGSGRGT
jgi:hypothetical protein